MDETILQDAALARERAQRLVRRATIVCERVRVERLSRASHKPRDLLLRHMADEHPGLTLDQAADETGLPLAIIERAMAELRDEGYATRRPQVGLPDLFEPSAAGRRAAARL